MKIYQGQGGQFGDAIMSLRLSEYLKEIYPDAEIVSGISQKYSSILPVLSSASYVDRWIIWEGYCETFPSNNDKDQIEKEKFDIFFHPMQSNHKPGWFKDTHQVADMFLRHGINPPDNLKINLPAPRVSIQKNLVAFAPFPNFGEGCKCLSIKKAQSIVDYLTSKNYKIIQLGTNKEPKLENVDFPLSSWLDTSKILNQCEFLITTDTAVSWLASAYSVPTVGLYGYEGYYNGVYSSKNWQPINPNAIYLEEKNCNDIKLRL